MTARSSSPACQAGGLEVFWAQDGLPVSSMLLLDDPHEARAFPVGAMRLAWCAACGFVCNAAHEEARSEYSARYEASQAYSAVFQSFATGLARRWIERYDLRRKVVLEIGCDKGDFLALLCAMGDNTGIGIDPAATARPPQGPAADRLTFIAEPYSQAHAGLVADVVVCRHTLEHIADPFGFLRTLRRSLEARPDTLVLFEVPDVRRVLEELAFWDVYYEHCSYFTAGSLVRLFRRCGFDVRNLEVDFGGQYLVIEAVPGTGAPTPVPGEDDLGAVASAVARFRDGITPHLEMLRVEARERGRSVIWGGGSKGVSYLTTLGAGAAFVAAVDVNPHKQGRYLPGTGLPVVAPGELTAIRPEVVVAMNPLYLAEIQGDLDRFGITASLVAAGTSRGGCG